MQVGGCCRTGLGAGARLAREVIPKNAVCFIIMTRVLGNYLSYVSGIWFHKVYSVFYPPSRYMGADALVGHLPSASRWIMGYHDRCGLPKITKEQDPAISCFFRVHRISRVFQHC